MFSDMIEEAYFRLREFDNLLRDLGIASVKELKRILTTNAVWQENQALKTRWEKLKEWVKNKMETCPNEEWYDFEEMFCEMQELEE